MAEKRDSQDDEAARAFAARFAARVDALGLKDADIARKTGISTSAISRYRLGGWPKANNLFSLAEVLKCSPRWLISGEDDVSSDVVALPVLRGTAASAGDGALPLDYDEFEPLPFPKDWLRGLGDPKNLAMIQVKGDSMFPLINSGDWVIFDLSRTGPADGVYLIRHEGELLVKRVDFFDAEIRIRSENRHWPEKAAPYSALDDAAILQIIGRVVWTGRLLN